MFAASVKHKTRFVSTMGKEAILGNSMPVHSMHQMKKIEDFRKYLYWARKRSQNIERTKQLQQFYDDLPARN